MAIDIYRYIYYFRDLILRIFFESRNIIRVDLDILEFITIRKKKLIRL
jgi:hypothetical protein